jgi:hypothetical protein
MVGTSFGTLDKACAPDLVALFYHALAAQEFGMGRPINTVGGAQDSPWRRTRLSCSVLSESLPRTVLDALALSQCPDARLDGRLPSHVRDTASRFG